MIHPLWSGYPRQYAGHFVDSLVIVLMSFSSHRATLFSCFILGKSLLKCQLLEMTGDWQSVSESQGWGFIGVLTLLYVCTTQSVMDNFLVFPSLRKSKFALLPSLLCPVVCLFFFSWFWFPLIYNATLSCIWSHLNVHLIHLTQWSCNDQTDRPISMLEMPATIWGF